MNFSEEHHEEENFFCCLFSLHPIRDSSFDRGVRLQPIPLWREGNSSDSDPDLERLNSALVRFAEGVRPAVVHIRAVPSSGAALNNVRGSGFIINPQGYILTAHHVVAGAKEIEIRLADGQRFRG